MRLTFSVLLLALLSGTLSADPLRAVRVDPLRAAKVVPVSCSCGGNCADCECTQKDCLVKKSGCQCTGCACENGEPCVCGGGCACESCPGTLTYWRANGCVYEYRGNKPTGVCWDAAGRKWVNGKQVLKVSQRPYMQAGG